MLSTSPPRRLQSMIKTSTRRLAERGSTTPRSSPEPSYEAAGSAKCHVGGTAEPYSFPETSIVTVTECDFLQRHTPQAVLDMIKDKSYEARLAAFLDVGDPPSGEGGVVLRQLFGKYLTQSDVGQRKGLVVPKKDAEEYFPDVKRCEEETMILRFLDRGSRRWLDLRYCFYHSSQSYVLTTGWCKYAKANALKEKDLIKFYECAKGGSSDGDGERYIMIDIDRCAEAKGKEVEVEVGSKRRIREEVMVVRKRKYKISCETRTTTKHRRNGVVVEIDEEGRNNIDIERGVKLFGVIIG